MAVVVRYFSTSAAGSGDGTTWANRAAFISAGAYSTVITGFNFNSTDCMEARLGPGTYSSAPTFQNSIFTVAGPMPKNPLVIHGCDSSGNRLTPDVDWNCCQGALDTTGYPVWSFGTNTFNGASNILCRCLWITATTPTFVFAPGQGTCVDYCRIERTGDDASASGWVCGNTFVFGNNISNSHIICTSTRFNSLSNSGLAFSNCRFEGNSSATLGNRYGIYNTASAVMRVFNQNCIINCPGSALLNLTSGTNAGIAAHGFTIVNCATASGAAVNAPNLPSTATNTQYNTVAIHNCFIANCGVGVNTQNVAAILTNNRLRNTSNYTLPTHSLLADNYESAGSDSDEFVNAAGGDYRIKSTSTYWGKNLGAGDQPLTGGTSKPTNPFSQTVIA